MPEVHMDVRAGDTWSDVGHPLRPDDPLGSLSSIEPDGRQIIVFGFDAGEPGVWRSVAGADVEVGSIRALSSLGFERLADLRDGPRELLVNHPRMGPLEVRFRFVP